jgi:hypothetical protein
MLGSVKPFFSLYFFQFYRPREEAEKVCHFPPPSFFKKAKSNRGGMEEKQPREEKQPSSSASPPYDT